MAYLLIALAALAAGPLTLDRLRQQPALAAALDGFVVVSITTLVFLHFVPAAVETRNFALMGGLLLGFLIPLLLERLNKDTGGQTDRWALILGITGLAIHAGLDGAALATVDGSGSGTPLALAVILHRLPVGIAVWWLASTVLGRRSGIAALIALMVATAVGFYSGTAIMQLPGTSQFVGLYQSVVAGALVHVVMHPGHVLHRAGIPHAEGWGGLAALAVVLVVSILPGAAGAHGAGLFLNRLFVLAAESAPALLLAYLFAGLLSAFLPSASIRWLGRGGALSQAGRGMLVGLPFPICSCGVVPLYRTLVARGAPPAAAMAFLVATPELGLDAILLSIPLLGADVAFLRVATAIGAALLVGWWVGGRLKALPVHTEVHEDKQAAGVLGARFRSALITGTGEVVDHTAPWILLGLSVAALVTPWLGGGWLADFPSPIAIILFAALGFPIYVCAASATPLVAALLAAGLSPGAGIAFLITGPATNLSTLGVLSSLHGRRAAMAFTGVLLAFAFAAGLMIDTVFESFDSPTLEELTGKDPTTVELVSLAGLTLLFGASIVRRGIRRFVAEIGEGLGWKQDHHHDHSHA